MLNQTKNKALERIQTEAATVARQHFGKKTEGLYVPGAEVPMTKERACAAALEANPELYEDYRRSHNANAIVAALERAGVRLSR